MQERIIEKYPPFIQRMNEFKQLSKAEENEFDSLYINMEKSAENMFVSTANEKGVIRFEELLDIMPRQNQTLDERKAFILFAMNRRKMNLTELQELMTAYAKDINLIPDYNNEELKVLAGECVSDLRTAYNMLDELLPMQVYIYFSIAIMVSLVFKESFQTLILNTDIMTVNIIGMKSVLETFIHSTEEFETANIIMEKDLWLLDGSVSLDGSRILDAECKGEEL